MNARGGGEYGEEWHRAGMLAGKQSTIDDVVGAARALITSGWTRPEDLVVRGVSNGGLVAAAAAVQRPELFSVALGGSALLDMVAFPRLGAGKFWESEFETPSDPDQLRGLLSYSAYHDVRHDVQYPAILLLASDADDRVDPAHSRKFAAALQASLSTKPALLRMEPIPLTPERTRSTSWPNGTPTRFRLRGRTLQADLRFRPWKRRA